MDTYIKISDCAVIIQGKNLDKKYLNSGGRGLPYVVGASCLKDCGLVCGKFSERTANAAVSQKGDVIISTVGTLGKMAVNNIGDVILSGHVCAVRFVPQILPQYGMLSLMGAMHLCIPPEDETKTGFSRKLDVNAVGELPLLLAAVDYQQAVVSEMILLGREFHRSSNVLGNVSHFCPENLPDDPVELIRQFEKESREKLREQHKILEKIVKIITDNSPIEEMQTSLFQEA